MPGAMGPACNMGANGTMCAKGTIGMNGRGVPVQMGGVGKRRASTDTIVGNRKLSADTMVGNRRPSADTMGIPGQIGGAGIPGLIGGVCNRRLSADSGMGF